MKINLHKVKTFLFSVFILFTFSSFNESPSSYLLYQSKNDSIAIWIKASSNRIYSIDKRKKFLKKAHKKIAYLNDSLKVHKLSLIAYSYINLKDSTEFFKINNELLGLATKTNNSYFIADAHWNFGDYYLFEEIFDKSYYHHKKASDYFLKSNSKVEYAKVLRGMAIIRGRYRDYTGSEVLLIECIKIFKELKIDRQLYHSYNSLALIQNDIKEYDRALKYHEIALEYLNKVQNKKNFYSSSLTNIGYSYILKSEFKKAIEYLDKALINNNSRENYARIIDHLAYSRMKLNDTTNVEKDMLTALKIRDSLKIRGGVLYSRIRLAQYYSTIHKVKNAKANLLKSKTLAKKLKNGRDYLKSLNLLSDIDSINSSMYLKEYIKYNDSMITSERKTLNKFTRIEFETDEVIEDNKLLSQKLIWFFSGSIALILIFSLLYFIRAQKAKNEKLFLETEQQKANEEVYLLTLRKQAELEEEKVRERNRISQELHDGILGKLFGTRVGMGFLDINADEKTQKQHEAFLDELQEIEKEIRDVSHKLNDNFEDLDVNFTTIINQLLESKSKIGQFQFHLNIDQNISWKSTDEIIKVNVYRIIQETLQNTIKHAQAKNVTLDFSTNEQELNVQIKDDGQGFNLKKSKKGIGLKNIRSRIEKLNGTVEILSAPNKGTQIHIKIPIV